MCSVDFALCHNCVSIQFGLQGFGIAGEIGLQVLSQKIRGGKRVSDASASATIAEKAGLLFIVCLLCAENLIKLCHQFADGILKAFYLGYIR